MERSQLLDVTSIIQKGVQLANFSVDNIYGFLTGESKNNLDQEDAEQFSEEMRAIAGQFAHIISDNLASPLQNTPELAALFQYFFDKSVEVTYKMIVGVDVDTQFQPYEAFSEHYPDLPEYIQVKLTRVVPNMAGVLAHLSSFMERNGYFKYNTCDWLLPILLSASIIGFRFAIEMDLDDDSELESFFSQMEDE